MSKISGLNLGNPNEPFEIQGAQFGGRDQAISIPIASANINRHKIDNLVNRLNSDIKQIFKLIETFEVMQEMMTLDDETDSVILDKKFVNQYSKNVKELKTTFTGFVEAANNK